MSINPLLNIKKLGQSVWLDYIQRNMLLNGEFETMITRDGISGMTSNPAIFEKAILESNDYDDAISQLTSQGTSAIQIYEILVLEDIRHAADLLQPVYVSSNGKDGYISIEVSPYLAYNTELTVSESIRLWKDIDKPNVMIKVPATYEGLPAIEQLIAAGINVNITLLFGLERYKEVINAFITGLEIRAANNQSLKSIASVASFFISRIDSKVDFLLDEIKSNLPEEIFTQLRGSTAIALASIAYQEYKKIFSENRWKKLAAMGAQNQRLLWASTSAKDKTYSDTKYVEALIGPDTVNTMPLTTIRSYRKHGNPQLRLEQDLDKAKTVIIKISEIGINLELISQQLEKEGVQKFIDPFDQLIATLEQKCLQTCIQ